MTYRSVLTSPSLDPPNSIVGGELFRTQNKNYKMEQVTSFTDGGSAVARDLNLLNALKAGKNVFITAGITGGASVYSLPTLTDILKIFPGVKPLTTLPFTIINTANSSGYTVTVDADNTGGDATYVLCPVATGSTEPSSQRFIIKFTTTVSGSETVDGYSVSQANITFA